MTFNIFYGGDELDLATGDWCTQVRGCKRTLATVIRAIRDSGADVVGLEEGEHSTRTIADALGWYASERMQVVSRYPLIDPPGGNGTYIYVELRPGRVVAMENAHLPSDPYGPYLVRDGGSPHALTELELSTRMPAIEDEIAAVPGLASREIPVFLTGDFNSPSHLDWTPAVAAVRPEVVYPFLWPVSEALAGAGFRDSYRQVHPDPVAVPGFTWTPGGPESVPGDVFDRIDWVLAAGPARALESQIVGEKGGPDVDLAVIPYPTDHRGVVSTFSVRPGEPSPFVAVARRRMTIGRPLSVVVHSHGRRGEQVGIVRAGGEGADAVARVSTRLRHHEDGTVLLSTAGLGRGAYEAVLLDKHGDVLSRSAFWLYRPGERTKVWTARHVYTKGSPITVSWSNAPGMRWDWVSVFPAGGKLPKQSICNVGYCGNDDYLLYKYTHTQIEGSATITEDSLVGNGSWPLKPGRYEIRLLLDDGYRAVARSKPFRVVRPG